MSCAVKPIILPPTKPANTTKNNCREINSPFIGIKIFAETTISKANKEDSVENLVSSILF